MAPTSATRVARCLVIALVLTSAAVAVSAQETEDSGYPVDDVDRTDFSEEHLKSDDEAVGPTGPHSDVEPAWIFPDSPDSKLPVGGTTDLLVALANSGSKMFNVSHVEGQMLDGAGKLALTLPRVEYGQSLAPQEQRSLRYPITLDKEAPLGEYTLVAKVYYNTRAKEPFVATVLNETVELVPPLPSGDAQLRMMQAALGLVGVLVVLLLIVRSSMASADAKGKPGKKAKSNGAADPAANNEWLKGTLAGTEGRVPKKTKQG
jgi:hypothetical protein